MRCMRILFFREIAMQERLHKFFSIIAAIGLNILFHQAKIWIWIVVIN